MNERWRAYQLVYIERDFGLVGAAAEALLPERLCAAKYVLQFTKERQSAKAKDVSWEEFKTHLTSTTM
jgi:hypothetical protein